jgi:hypothetical protein
VAVDVGDGVESPLGDCELDGVSVDVGDDDGV